MRTYNQQIEDAYVGSKRQGDMMRNREIERSAGQDRRNRYRDDKYLFHPEHAPFEREYRGENERMISQGAASRYSNRGYSDEDFEQYHAKQKQSSYPDTYRSAASGYMSEHVGYDSGRRDYHSGVYEEGNLYGATYGLYRGKGPKNYRRSDDRIREDINDQLTDNPDIDASDIEVIVQNCEVVLSGTVSSRSEKRRAEDIAESVTGVTHLENRIRVSVPA